MYVTYACKYEPKQAKIKYGKVLMYIKLLGVTIDIELKFDKDISNICLKPAENCFSQNVKILDI